MTAYDFLLGSDVPGAVDAVPIHAVAPADYEAWLSARPAPQRDWLKAAGFKPERHHVGLVPAASGDCLAAVVLGLGAERAAEDPYLWGGLASGLPEGVYRLAEEGDERLARMAVLGWALGRYRFARYRAGEEAGPTCLVLPAGVDRSAAEAAVRAHFLVRDLVNTPANDMGPAELAEIARQVARDGGARFTEIVGDELRERGYPAVHAVGRASSRAPRMIEFRWGREDHPLVTLVGKGVCFDSGGLDIKTAAGMRLMKKDMGGAAHALALAGWIMTTGLPVRLRVLVPAVENSVSGDAYRPGDVIKTRKGLTVEIENTDAEGRTVMCDALAAAAEESPALILDFATLTGSARVALGPDVPAFFTNDEALAEDLACYSAQEADPIWRLPLWQPYREYLESKVADIVHAASGPYGGAITAALFLQNFVEDDAGGQWPWAHFDIFAWNLKPRPGRPEGGEAMALRAAFALIERRFQDTRSKS